jgi:DNA (cytosine-5)-methyltransferase 1
MSQKIKLIDLFCGSGAFSYAFSNVSDKFEAIYANDMEKSCETIYKLNHENVEFKFGDINDINVENIPNHDILCGGFPCFVSGTKTLTNNGYKNIETIQLTDKLLTHNGNFQNILNLQKKIYFNDLFDIKIKYIPNIITTTEEHPFYIREKKEKNIFGNPIWKKANELSMNDYFGMVINNKKIIPNFQINISDYWYIGYLLGNGSTEFPNKNIILSILKDFGNNDYEKLIPEWLQDAPIEFIQEFMNGYVKENSSMKDDNFIQIKTLSLNLAYGIQRLYLKLGYIFSISIYPKKSNVYYIRGILQKNREIGSFIENNYVWYEPFNITKKSSNKLYVYNFEVENDNSYVVENICVHNCQPFSIAGKQMGFEDKRSNVFWKILDIIKYHLPKIVILENVKNLKTHDNNNTFKIITEKLEECGYYIKFNILDTCKITEIPQHRERIYICCFKNKDDYDKFNFDFESNENNSENDKVKEKNKDKNKDKNNNKNKKIKDFLEENIDNKYYYTNKYQVYNEIKTSLTKNISENVMYQYRRKFVRENKSNCCPTLTANMGTGGHNVPLLMDDKGIRKLTPRECFNLQGFNKNYKLPNISDALLYKIAGNAVSVPVVELIAIKINELFI